MTTVCQRPGFVVRLAPTSEPRIHILRMDVSEVPVGDDLEATPEFRGWALGPELRRIERSLRRPQGRRRVLAEVRMSICVHCRYEGGRDP